MTSADPNAGSHKSWAFTCNNYTENDLMALDNLPESIIKYVIFGEEVGPKTGTPHLQGYISFCKTHRRYAVTQMLTSRFRLSVAKKCDKANERYCVKGANVKIRDYRHNRKIDYRTTKKVTSTSQDQVDRIAKSIFKSVKSVTSIK